MRRSDALFYEALGMAGDDPDALEVGEIYPQDHPEVVELIMREYVATVRRKLAEAQSPQEKQAIEQRDFLTYAEYLEVLNYELEDPRETFKRHVADNTYRDRGYNPPQHKPLLPYGLDFLRISNNDDLNYYKKRLSPDYEGYIQLLTTKGPPFKAFFF